MLLLLLLVVGATATALTDTVDMFTHAYTGYMTHAYPHDELKPISGGYTDTLSHLGNGQGGSTSNGTALTLIDSLDTVMLIQPHLFHSAMSKVESHVPSFDLDQRVHVFEVTIRVLGGLLSAHHLARDTKAYSGFMLDLAIDLGDRLLPSFQEETLLPYAWVHLQRGVLDDETTESCVACIGTLILEFGTLSHMSGNPIYYEYAYTALLRLWALRDPVTGLLGNTLDIRHGQWKNTHAGIGAGVDSFHEYLLKAYILFNNVEFLYMFQQSYASVLHYLKHGPWYYEADMRTGRVTHSHFNSLQAFWPGLQSTLGHIDSAKHTLAAFYSVWTRFDGLPERYIVPLKRVHTTERYYPLRPELVESAYLLYRATGDTAYRAMGEAVISSLNTVSRVQHGYASVKNVLTGELEDHMHSFFLAESCKYLWMLFNDDMDWESYHVLSTEAHLLPLGVDIQESFPLYGDMSTQDLYCSLEQDFTYTSASIASLVQPPFEVTAEEGAFYILYTHDDGVEELFIQQLGTNAVEVYNQYNSVIDYYTYSSKETRRVILQLSTGLRLVGAESIHRSTVSMVEDSPLVLLDTTGCSPIPERLPVPSIAIVYRGTCSFTTKAQNMYQAGALALVVLDTLGQSLFLMGGDPTPIPTILLTSHDSMILESQVDATTTTGRLVLETSTAPVEDIQALGGWKVRLQRNGSTHHLLLL